MTDLSEMTAAEIGQPHPLANPEYVRYFLAQLRIRPTGLWQQARELSTWLETEVFPRLEDQAEAELVLKIQPDGAIKPQLPQTVPLKADQPFARLGRFFLSIGIGRLVLEHRLEWNQITDILALLYAFRCKLRKGRYPSRSVLAHLISPEGIIFSCTRTRIVDGSLHIAYTYCRGRLSTMLQWFKNRQSDLQDHRAIFRAAPKYALVIAGVALLHVGGFWLTDSWWVLVALTAAESVFVFVLVYLVLMAVGSLEYDKEEQSHRLGVAYKQLQRYARRIQDDLGRARSVQQQMLPDLNRMPLTDQLSWAGTFLPESEVGGDYFDAHALDEDRAAILFCDVSGHGMSAAFVTAILNTAFVGWVEDSRDITDFVYRLNRRVCVSTPTESFAAVFAAVYDVQNRQIEYINCGHSPEPWLIPADSARPVEQLNDSRGLLMGVDEELFHVSLRRRRVGPGDTVVLLTDGIVEATDLTGEMFGKDRVTEILQANRSSDPQEIVDQIVRQSEQFSQDKEPADDRTILAMRVRDA